MACHSWMKRCAHMAPLPLALFFFMASSASAQDPEVAGFNKGFFLKSMNGDFELKIGAQIQVRYQYDGVDGFGDATELGTGEDDASSFSLPRARLFLKGHAFGKALTYTFQSDFGKGEVSLKDFYANYELTDGFHVRAGQWKRPFSRQQINSSSKLLLADRAITDTYYGAGRDIGVVIHNGYEASPEFEWAAGIFNGTSIKPDVAPSLVDPDEEELPELEPPTHTASPFEPALVARIGYNMGGIKGYSGGDLEGGDFRLSVGAGAMWIPGFGDAATAVRANVDFVMKVSYFALSGAFYAALDESADEEGNTSLDLRATGLHAQASFLMASAYQPVVRFAWHQPEEVAPGSEDLKAITVGFNWFFHGHQVKWQTDVTATMVDDGNEDINRTDMRVGTQLQFAF